MKHEVELEISCLGHYVAGCDEIWTLGLGIWLHWERANENGDKNKNLGGKGFLNNLEQLLPSGKRGSSTIMAECDS